MSNQLLAMARSNGYQQLGLQIAQAIDFDKSVAFNIGYDIFASINYQNGMRLVNEIMTATGYQTIEYNDLNSIWNLIPDDMSVTESACLTYVIWINCQMIKACDALEQFMIDNCYIQ